MTISGITARFRGLLSGHAGRLAVLAYHRVGNRASAKFDPWLYTATALELEQHITYCKQRFHIAGLEEAIAIAQGREQCRGTAVLFTFDDGYLDNYEVAFPILKAAGVEAVFFLVSNYSSGKEIPWWDNIASIIRRAPDGLILLGQGGASKTFSLLPQNRELVIKDVLDYFKSLDDTGPEEFIAELERVCRTERPAAESLFMTWENARELAAAGMRLGAHTRSHRILSRLSPAEQLNELRGSREDLLRETKQSVTVLAYPVGGKSDFTETTKLKLREAGFLGAFSCYGGFNVPGRAQLSDIRRVPVYWGARAEWLIPGDL